MTSPHDVLTQVLADLAAEGERLDAVVAGLDEAGWRTPTPAPAGTSPRRSPTSPGPTRSR